MEYQKIMHLLDNKWNQPSKFRTQSWAEINGYSNDFKLTAKLTLF